MVVSATRIDPKKTSREALLRTRVHFYLRTVGASKRKVLNATNATDRGPSLLGVLNRWMDGPADQHQPALQKGEHLP